MTAPTIITIICYLLNRCDGILQLLYAFGHSMDIAIRPFCKLKPLHTYKNLSRFAVEAIATMMETSIVS